ncbi:nicotinamide-nucleotide amidohydrolase family protein [Altererythrobacter soli]|uniref:Nicotinamide-nucleotide amidohydrolase family protein n=1 Tax=Croceibacterium soli TaxID=1739690 RepID=A0A6I4UVE8_9SPHN|nr:CinA family protein [Croceibacterium soli]MXP41005.1 nicotinamide-nucleotide amidohydrolase family protein [Croceibacterium soli]
MADTLDPALPPKVQDRAQRVLELADKRELMLTTAESCTGGLLAALLTDVQGFGHVFERGFVVYSKQAKCDLLGIARNKVDGCGAVSEEIAVEMAHGALRFSNADVALSITGFAGPGGDDDEEGLVHFACARKDGTVQHREEHFGPIGRDGVRIASLDVALQMIEQALKA